MRAITPSPWHSSSRSPWRIAALLPLACGALASAAGAVDHNNLDAGRPLDFDDADAIAYHEKAIEVGASVARPRKGRTGVEGNAEFLYGFAPNSHVSLSFHPDYESENGGRRRLNAGDTTIGVFHNFNREYNNTPAFSLRADASLPTGRDSRGIDFRLRGIASKQIGQYDRLHLNLDLNVNNGAQAGERKTQPGLILGYSKPLGYPTRFDRTLVAQIGYRANPDKGENGLVNVGIGLRQQVGIRSVFDIGISSDIAGGRNRDSFKLVAGYSRQF
jgi:hypothetical protein